MSGMSRRSFMKGSLVTAATTGIIGGAWSRVLGANDDVRVAIVGINSQGNGHIGRFSNMKGVRVVALCDPDKAVLDKRVKSFTDKQQKVDAYIDVRKLLDDKNIDAIVTASPNHWHSLITVWSCQAGKDVYVEKPVSHNVWEGRKAVEAARKYNRIVQTGTQKRSDEGLKEAFEYIQQGNLGEITVARGFCYKTRKSIGKVSGPQQIPASVDYNLWCGPAPLEPLRRQKLHYDWHWVYETGNGDMGNQGIHEMDLCRWAIGADTLPKRVMSVGGRIGYDDDGTTPNTQIAILDYEPAPIIFETRGLPRQNLDWGKGMDNYRGTRVGLVVECENGYFVGGGGGGWIYDKNGEKVKKFSGGGGRGHHENFIKAVRSRKVSDLNADILEGHLSSALCHLGGISHQLGHTMSQEKIREQAGSNKLFLDSCDRMLQHTKANGIDLKQTPLTLGPQLDFDPVKEKFTGDNDPYGVVHWANDLVTRNYRAPFVVPETV